MILKSSIRNSVGHVDGGLELTARGGKGQSHERRQFGAHWRVSKWLPTHQALTARRSFMTQRPVRIEEM